MNPSRGALVLSGLLVLAGCAVKERPAPASYTEPASEGALVKPVTTPGPTLARVCEPGTTRECKFYYWGPNGTWNCPTSIQICRRDGIGWHRCNDLNPKETDPVEPEESDEEVPDEPPILK